MGKSLKVPSMTHLQYAVMQQIGPKGTYAVQISESIGMDGPRFYQLMARMVDAGYVRSGERVVIGNSRFTFYKATAAGRDAQKYAVNFYRGINTEK